MVVFHLHARWRCQNGTQQALFLRTSRPPPLSGTWRGLHLARSVSDQREPDEAPAGPPQLEHWEVLSGGQCLPQCEDTVCS